MKLSTLNPFMWFRVIRHLAMLGPEARRLNRNVESIMHHFGIVVPPTDTQLRIALADDPKNTPQLQSFEFNETAAFIDDVRTRLSRGEQVPEQDIIAAAEYQIQLEEERFNREE